MKDICITDHQDWFWPVPGESFDIDTDSYFNELNILKNKYSSKINLHIGVELGITCDNYKKNADFLQSYPFEYVIGSCHIVDQMDPYYAEFWEGKNDRDCFELYFKTLLDSLKSFIGRNTCTTPRTVNTLGHLDYIVRYSPNKDNNYSVADYIDVIDEILKMIIENDIKLEINTSNFSKGFDFPNPHTDIIRRYKELGGLYVTVGSDAHKAQFIGSGFDLVEKYKLKVFTI